VLGVFGDSGEIEAFRKYEFSKAKKGPPSDLTLVKAVPDGNWECNFSDGTVTKKFSTDQVMPNWTRVLTGLKDKIAASDALTVLGDMVYPESKFYGESKDLTSASKAGNLWKEPAGETDNDKRERYWQQRRHCGWIAFTKSFGFVDSVKAKYSDKSGKLNAIAQLLPGNHLYDISAKNELAQMGVYTTEDKAVTTWYSGKNAPIQSDKPLWTNSVRVTKVAKDGVKVVFIDFNSAIFELVDKCNPCETDKDVLKAITSNIWDSFLMGKKDIVAQEVFDHIEGLFEAIGKEKDNGIVALRAHHPPFNLEGDMGGILHYRSVGHGKITLLEACKASKISLYLASHHHSAQLWAFPYDKVDANLSKVKVPAGTRKNDFSDCNDTSGKKCKGSSFAYDLKLDDPKFLFVVLVGNSGRFFDPCESDDASIGHSLWCRAGTSLKPEAWASNDFKKPENSATFHYGGAMMTFSKTAIKTEYYEVENGKPAVVTNTFTLTIKTASTATIKGVDGSKAKTSRRNRRLIKKQLKKQRKLRKQRRLRKLKKQKRRLRRKH